MCLGIPGRIIGIEDEGKKLALADVCGVRRRVNVGCLSSGGLQSLVGEWVLIHVGFAMSRIDEEEAERTLEVLRMLGEAQEELEAMRMAEAGLVEERP